MEGNRDQGGTEEGVRIVHKVGRSPVGIEAVGDNREVLGQLPEVAWEVPEEGSEELAPNQVLDRD
jgi:hypothetical protein